MRTLQINTIDAAAICHEANRAYCANVLNDQSQPPWTEAPTWQRVSAIQGVLAIVNAPDEYTPENSHENWMKHKEQDGWVYGETKDPEKKTHPCMLPYAELPQEQKIKDSIFHAIVHALLSPE